MLRLFIRMNRDDFGPSLKQERERQGISLQQLAVATKVSVELWEAMERNDFSRWPSGVFARAFIRDYARAIGLDSDAVVNEFCRHFPVGDRRASRIVREQAQLIGHRLDANDRELLPSGRERRRAREPQPVPPAFALYMPRIASAAIDVASVCLLALFGAQLFGAGFLASAGLVSVVYFTSSTVGLGASPGMRILEALRLRAPSLFASRRTVNA